MPLVPDGSSIVPASLTSPPSERKVNQIRCSTSAPSPASRQVTSRALRPRARTEELLSSIGQRELGRFHTYLEPGQGQGAQVVVQQPGTVGKGWILITDQAIEARAVAGTSRFDQSIDGRSDLAKPRALRRHAPQIPELVGEQWADSEAEQPTRTSISATAANRRTVLWLGWLTQRQRMRARLGTSGNRPGRAVAASSISRADGLRRTACRTS